MTATILDDDKRLRDKKSPVQGRLFVALPCLAFHAMHARPEPGRPMARLRRSRKDFLEARSRWVAPPVGLSGWR